VSGFFKGKLKDLSEEQLDFLKNKVTAEIDFKNLINYNSIYEKRNLDNELIGLAGTTKRHRVFKTLFLAIKDSEQGKGNGKSLFKEMWESENPKPLLTVYKDNSRALKIYRKYYFFVPYFHKKYLGVPKEKFNLFKKKVGELK